MIRFERDNDSVVLRIDSELETSKPVYRFTCKLGDQEHAELATRRLNEIMEGEYRDAAENACAWLDHLAISELKRKLSEWNTKTGTWK